MADPVTLDEIRPVFVRCLEGPLCLAVSGGADSMALLHLVADWRDAAPSESADVQVVTIDHGLRAASSAEAGFVADVARRRGLAHLTRHWSGAKPATGLQEAARDARYRLLAEAALAASPPACVVTAHHAGDLAETLLLRLARGSGVRGLSAMTEISALPLTRIARAELDAAGLRVARPLLDLPKARLEATLRARGLDWCQDPSNDDPAYERVRWRAARPALAALGLEPPALVRTARRLARAEAAIGSAADALLATCDRHPTGAESQMMLSDFAAAPAEIAIRVLEALLVHHGGQPESPRLARVEAAHAAICAAAIRREALTTTLGGCRVVADAAHGRLAVCREMRGGRLEDIELAPGQRAVWDLRYRCTAGPDLVRPVRIAALGAAGWRAVAASPSRAQGAPRTQPADLSRDAAATLPAVYRDGVLACVPLLGWRSSSAGDCDLQVEPLRLGR